LDFGFIPARFSQSPDLLIVAGLTPLSWPRALFTLISHMFVHGSFLHLAINSLWLLAFGTPVARRFGTLKFLIFFLLCGIAGALAHLAVYWDSPAPVVGASGAVSGLMAAGIRIMYGWANALHDGPPGLAPLRSRPVLVFTALWVVTNIVAGIAGIGTTDDLTLIAWEAHLGGFVAGLIAFYWLDRRN
jgi:membrane associated rhomboid family serine protease